MKRRLLAVQGPLQYIAGYIAFSADNPLESQTENVLLLYDFLASPKVEDEIADAIKALSKSAKWDRVVFINGHEMGVLMRNRYAHSIRIVKALIGSEHFDEIYLARNHLGHGSPLLMNAYAEATKVEYGDSFGLVGQRETLTTLQTTSIQDRLRTALRGIVFGRPQVFEFDRAVLSLPIDVSGHYLSAMSFSVPDRAHVQKCVEQVYNCLPELKEYCEELFLFEDLVQNQLFLLSNLSASGLSSPDRELGLYLAVIRARARYGGTIYLKPHPRSTFEILDGLLNALKSDYRVTVIDDARFARIPIELWVDLVSKFEVIALFSTSAINLKYLYAKQVILPLDDCNASQYFNSSAIDHVASTNRFIRECLFNLDHWDGKSVLWNRERNA